MIVYFSGTGNSRYVAQLLAKELNDELLDATKHIKAGVKGILHSEKPWIFVAPIYGWQLPHVFYDYIRDAELSGNRNTYFVMTCGSDIGNAPAHASELCKAKGLAYKGMMEVVMPENYIAMFPVPDAVQSARIIDRSRPAILNGASLIQQGQPFPEKKSNVLDRLKSGPVNRLFYRFFVKADSFYAKDTCIGCRKCEIHCMLNNIHLREGKPVWGNACTHCMACICGCPVEAIEYGKASKGKPRYQCPGLDN